MIRWVVISEGVLNGTLNLSGLFDFKIESSKKIVGFLLVFCLIALLN